MEESGVTPATDKVLAGASSSPATAAKNKNPFGLSTSLALAAASIIWWVVAAQQNWWRFVLEVGLSLASFMVGCLVAFIFTSYGEEAGTIGKIRDWLIGGITGLTLAKASSIKGIASFRSLGMSKVIGRPDEL